MLDLIWSVLLFFFVFFKDSWWFIDREWTCQRKDLHVFLILDISDLNALLQFLQETCLYVTKHVQ